MRILKTDYVSCTVRVTRWNFPEAHFEAAIGALVCVDLLSGRFLVEPDLWAMAEAQLGEAVLDEGFAKARGEVLAFGSVHAPGGSTTIAEARMRIGGIDKRLVAIGDRVWRRGVASEATSFNEIPLDWQHAFGGPSVPENPLGKGVEEQTGSRPLPNIEDPRHLILSPSDRPRPAGFRSLDANWPQRSEKLGTYDERWVDAEFPGFARDLDVDYFNTAPEDQRIAGFFRGDEKILINNMNADHPQLDGALPSVHARCFVDLGDGGDGEELTELAMHLETIVLLPAVACAVLVFRSRVEVREDDADDLRHLVLGLEALEERRPREHYLSIYRDWAARKRGARLKDRALLPSWFRRSIHRWRTPPDRGDLPTSEGLLERNVRRGLEMDLARGQDRRSAVQAAIEDAREHLQALALDPDGDPNLRDAASSAATSLAPAADLDEDDEGEDIAADAGPTEAEQLEAMLGGLEQSKLELMARLRAVCEENGLDFDEKRAEAGRDGGGPPKPEADEILERLRETAKLCTNAGITDDANDALGRLADPALEARLRELDDARIRMYREAAHYLPAAAVLDPELSARFRREVVEDRASGASFAGRDFTGADLSELDLSGSDFHQAMLERTNLRGTDLRGANFEQAVLVRADLEGAKTAGIRLAGANLGEASLRGLDLKGADLRGAVVLKSDMAGSSLAGAKIAMADFGEAVLTGADFEGAAAAGARFGEAHLEGARFGGADLSHALFQSVDVSGLDFTAAKLDGASFVECVCKRAIFRDASMINCRFTHIERRTSLDAASFPRANLTDANLRDVVLSGANFEGATLDDADLSASDCQEANFHRVVARNSLWIRTNLRGARMTSANLSNALMKNARLQATRFGHANLFNANLMYVHVDGATDIKDAELGHAAYVEAPK